MSRVIALVSVVVAVLVVAAPVSAGAPSDGGGNQFVVAVDDTFEISCGDETLAGPAPVKPNETVRVRN